MAPDNQDSSLQAVVQYAIDHHLGNVSNSYGEAENEADADTINAWNLLGEQASAKGISLNFSTGDDGDYLVATGAISSSSPSDSPWVTAVGGLSLDIPTKGGVIETGWGNDRAQLGYSDDP